MIEYFPNHYSLEQDDDGEWRVEHDDKLVETFDTRHEALLYIAEGLSRPDPWEAIR